jgi:signal transduction histidine kinase
VALDTGSRNNLAGAEPKKPKQKQNSLATRLSALYVTLLGITIVLVILASSIALVLQLYSYSSDIMVAKHAEARFLADFYQRQGQAFAQAAPQIVSQLSGIGLRVTVFDEKGHFLSGDRTLRPRTLDRIIEEGPLPPRVPPTANFLKNLPDTGHEVPPLTQVHGGFVAFAASPALLLVSLGPYWRIVITIAIIAILLSWFMGRLFAGQALQPINEVTESLRALAGGDYTQRRFIMESGDEVASLTEAYNDAVSGVALAMEERKRAEERMRQFAADAGHELRTPLTVIGGYIDVLRRGAVEEPKIARQILATMSIEKEHMRGLIDRLMRLARMDAETQPAAEEIDVAELLRNQVDAARRLDDRRVVDYSVEGANTIVADRSEIGEALWNIVENALKYAPEAPIHLRAVRNNGHTVISVRDEGPGMTEPERLHAFERFYRGDQRGEITGAGLGLAIAKRVVERAGGEIAIDSAPGQGTAVVITL